MEIECYLSKGALENLLENKIVSVYNNKMDKITRSQIKPRLADIRKTLNIDSEDEVVAYSAQSFSGRDEFWGVIEEFIKAEQI